MIIYIIKFPINFCPRYIGYKTYNEAYMICKKLKLPVRKNILLVFLEEDENHIYFNL